MNFQNQISWFFSALLTVACGAPIEGGDMDFSDPDSVADEASKKAKSDDAGETDEDDETVKNDEDEPVAQIGERPEIIPEVEEADEPVVEEEVSVEESEVPEELVPEEEAIERYAQVVTVENILPEDVTLQGAMSEIVGVFRLQNHWGNWNHLNEICFRNTGTGSIDDLDGVKLDAFHSYVEPAFTRTEDLNELNGSFCVEVAMTLGAEEELFLSFAIQTPMGEVLSGMWGTTYQFEITSISLEWGSEVRGLPAATGLVTMGRSQ